MHCIVTRTNNVLIPGMVSNKDTQIDIEPFIIHVDPRILDRLENYVYTLMEMKERRQSDATRTEDTRYDLFFVLKYFLNISLTLICFYVCIVL